MVTSSFVRSAVRGLALASVCVFAAGCRVVEPAMVDSTLAPTPALASARPGDIAVLPVEDGSPGAAASRHLLFLRQELMRQLPDRLYSPLTAFTVDSALAAKVAPREASAKASESMLAPAVLRTYVGHCKEDAVLALRIDRWDESRLLIDKRLRFELQAALMSVKGEQLWSGSLRGELKAGGTGAAPRDKDGMARSCATLAIGELLQRLPMRTP